MDGRFAHGVVAGASTDVTGQSAWETQKPRSLLCSTSTYPYGHNNNMCCRYIVEQQTTPQPCRSWLQEWDLALRQTMYSVHMYVLYCTSQKRYSDNEKDPEVQ